MSRSDYASFSDLGPVVVTGVAAASVLLLLQLLPKQAGLLPFHMPRMTLLLLLFVIR